MSTGPERDRQTAPPAFLREAREGDVHAMATLVATFARKGRMLFKSPEELLMHLERYVVLVDLSGGVVGCGGLRVYDADLAEIVSLAVAPEWQGTGQGGRLVEHLVHHARSLGIRDVFAMTLSPEFFARRDFEAVPRGWLEQKEASDCRSCPRRSGCREVAVLRTLEPEATRVNSFLRHPAEGLPGLEARPRSVRLPMLTGGSA